MNTSTSTSTRLGQILLDKGLITDEQLNIALFEQKQRRQLSDVVDKNQQMSLGEILIELGFIDRLQLKRGLSWQSTLRKVAIAMSFCAPLMTVSAGALAGSPRPSFTVETSSSSSVAKVSPSFTKSSSSVSSSVSRAASSSLPKSSSSSSTSSSSNAVKPASSQSSNQVELKISEIAIVEAEYDRVQLRWSPTSTNNIRGFKVFRDQVMIDVLDSADFYFNDFNVAADRTYVYGVSVGDAAGNWSSVKSILVKTQPAPKGVEVSSSSVSSVASSSTSNTSLASSSSVMSSSPSSGSSSSKTASSVASSASSKSVASSSAVSVVKSSVASSVSSANSSASSVSSSVASSSSSSSANRAAPYTVAGPVSFSWLAPNLRENGTYLDVTELGGYEFRYKKSTDNSFSYVTISDAWKNYHNFTWLEGTYVFQVAAFDKNGLYSSFVDIAPQ